MFLRRSGLLKGGEAVANLVEWSPMDSRVGSRLLLAICWSDPEQDRTLKTLDLHRIYTPATEAAQASAFWVLHHRSRFMVRVGLIHRGYGS